MISIRLSSRLETIKRQCMIRALSASLPLYVVNEYPKSGGSWVGEMLGDLLEVPFPRNRVPSLERSIMHGHYLHSTGMHNVVIVWRDGRDIMTSFYFHAYFKNDRNNGVLVDLMRGSLPFRDYTDVEANLPIFLERMLTRPITPRFTWQQFVSKWYGFTSAIHVKYESLLDNTAGELGRIIEGMVKATPSTERLEEIVERHSFRMTSGRPAGTEEKTSFLRKGIAGDWKNYFSREACEIFDHYAGNELIRLGYEVDREWVTR